MSSPHKMMSDLENQDRKGRVEESQVIKGHEQGSRWAKGGKSEDQCTGVGSSYCPDGCRLSG